MSGCLSTTSLGAEWFYPVIDPLRAAGPGPGGQWKFGYPFRWDGVIVSVARNRSLSRCQMRVELTSTLAETKQIQAFNFHNDAWSDHIDSDPTGAVTAMTIQRRRPGEGCDVGTDTVVLARATWMGPKGMYAFPPQDFWDFWGGCTVTFDWVFDTKTDPTNRPIGRSGAQTPPPSHPFVELPDRTLMRDEAGIAFRVVFGGTGFAADDSMVSNGVRYLDTFDPMIAPVPFRELPALPVDGTLVREWNRPEVYVIYGGAKFHIPDEPTLFALGFDWTRVVSFPRAASGSSSRPRSTEHRSKSSTTHGTSWSTSINSEGSGARKSWTRDACPGVMCASSRTTRVPACRTAVTYRRTMSRSSSGLP